MKTNLDYRLAYYRKTWSPQCDVTAFQQEIEDAFRLECNPEDIQKFDEAKKLYKYITKNRKRVNKINRLLNKIFMIESDFKLIYFS